MESLWDANLWRELDADELETPVKRFDDDFRVMVSQLADEVGCDADVLIVKRVPLAPLVSDVRLMDPDWDRYLGVTAHDLHTRGVISYTLARNYDTPEGFKQLEAVMKRLRLPDPYKYGFKRYIALLAEAIRTGAPIPPVLTVGGRLADGRHRVIAAVRLGLKTAPVAEVSC